MPVFDPTLSVALLLGVGRYDRPELFDSMPWIENNLSALSNVLIDQDVLGFNPTNVLIRPNPTNGSIAEELDILRERRPGLDTVLVYYCGHGVVEGGRYFLTGRDAGRTSAQKLAFEDFEAIFLRINARRKVLILDSCFSARAITGHLSSANSILEANLDRLSAEEQKRVHIETERQGTYVIASADRDKPAIATDERGELTAFTALFVKWLKTGIDRSEDQRLTINSIVDLVATDARQQGLPEPVKSDKFGLGDWRLFGNAAIAKRQSLNAAIVSEFRKELQQHSTAIGEKYQAEAIEIRRTIGTISDQIDSLNSRLNEKAADSPSSLVPDVMRAIERIEKRSEASIAELKSSLDEMSHQLTSVPDDAKTSNGISDDRNFISDGSRRIPKWRQLIDTYLNFFIILPALSLTGIVLVQYASKWILNPLELLIVKFLISAVYSVLLLLLEMGHKRLRGRSFQSREWLPTMANAAIRTLVFDMSRLIKTLGLTTLFWGTLLGIVLTWLGPALSRIGIELN